MSRLVWPLLGLYGALAGAPTFAQCTTSPGLNSVSNVTFTPVNVDFPAPTVADFNIGYIDFPTAVVVTVDRLPPQNAFDLCISMTGPTLGGAKAVGDLQWRRSDQATYSAGSLSYVPVQTFSSTSPATVSVTLYFRMLLPWDTTTPNGYSSDILCTTFEH